MLCIQIWLNDHCIIPEHCHQPREEGVDHKAKRKLIIACVLCLFFMVAEVVGKLI